MIAAMKRLLFLIGIVLTGAAFLATAAEIAANAMDPSLGLIPSAAEVWRAISPQTYEAFAAPESAWLDVLRLPGWLLLGTPGLGLMIVFRERDGSLSREHEESLFLYDELAKHAHEEGYTGTGDDFQPSDYADFVPAEDHYADDVSPDEGHTDAPTDAHEDGDEDGRDFLLDTPQTAATPAIKTPNDET